MLNIFCFKSFISLKLKLILKFYAAAIELLSTSILEKNYFIAVLLMFFFLRFL
jgi:hypothetical protein